MVDKKSPAQLALFDFDGTITFKETTLDFIEFACSTPRVIIGRLLLTPVLILYLLGILSHHRAKEIFLSHFFKGWDSERFLKLCHEYSTTMVDRLVRPKARERIAWHKEEGHVVAVVSGSLELWISQWCKDHGLIVIATGYDTTGPRLSGKLAGRNCYAGEKVVRIKKHFDLQSYSTIYAYGDSSGDKAMMELAHESFLRPFE